jgi:hypothetical protein
MGFVEWRSSGGLDILEHQGDEATISRELRKHDDDLRLIRGYDTERGVWLYKVYSYRGPNHPAEFILAWQTEQGEPLPLSSRLVDEVVRHDRNTRGRTLDADVKNAMQKAEEAKQWDRDQEALIDDWSMKHGRPILPRSQSLRRARDKRRARGENI